MYDEELGDIADAAAAQIELIEKRSSAYLVHAAMAGAYIGLAIVLVFVFGTALQGTVFEPLRGIVMAATFGLALSLVLIAGSELFTGNAMIMGVGAFEGRTTWSDLGAVWTLSWGGNLLGSVLVAAMAAYGGVFADPSLVASVAATKMTLTPLELFLQAVFCNWLVVLAVWCNFRLENAVAKLVMVWWCLLAFIGSGFEHSVANMTVLTLANLLPHSTAAVSWSGWLYNISIVTVGNAFAGVVMMGAAYWYIEESYRLDPDDDPYVASYSGADDD